MKVGVKFPEQSYVLRIGAQVTWLKYLSCPAPSKPLTLALRRRIFAPIFWRNILGYLLYISSFGILYQEKSGIPSV
jgi:hypothetical protein